MRLWFPDSAELVAKREQLDRCEVACRQYQPEPALRPYAALRTDWQYQSRTPHAPTNVELRVTERPGVAHQLADDCRTSPDGGHAPARWLSWISRSLTDLRQDMLDNSPRKLLNEGVFTEDMFATKDKDYSNGDSAQIRDLKKTRLCQYLCDEKRDPGDFRGFAVVLDMIEEWRRSLPTIVTPTGGQGRQSAELTITFSKIAQHMDDCWQAGTRAPRVVTNSHVVGSAARFPLI